MAEPLKYDPLEESPKTQIGARDELELLIETLHESGTLRTLRGLFGRMPEVLDVVLEKLDTGPGKNALGNVALAMVSLTRVDPSLVDRLMGALMLGLERARRSTFEHPPTLVGLAAIMMREDTRRGLHAMAVLLETIGAELGKRDGKSERAAHVHA